MVIHLGMLNILTHLTSQYILGYKEGPLMFSNSETISFSSTLSLHVPPPLRGREGEHELLAVSSSVFLCYSVNSP